MKTIVLFLALALSSAAFADEYTPVDWIQVTEGGGIEITLKDVRVKIGFLWVSMDYFNFSQIEGCTSPPNITINNENYSVHTSKWQRLGDDAEWSDVEGSVRNGELCAMTPTMPGEFRWVAEVEIGSVTNKYASGNTLIVAGDPEAEEAEDETAVETVTWGLLKSRVAP